MRDVLGLRRAEYVKEAFSLRNVVAVMSELRNLPFLFGDVARLRRPIFRYL